MNYSKYTALSVELEYHKAEREAEDIRELMNRMSKFSREEVAKIDRSTLSDAQIVEIINAKEEAEFGETLQKVNERLRSINVEEKKEKSEMYNQINQCLGIIPTILYSSSFYLSGIRCVSETVLSKYCESGIKLAAPSLGSKFVVGPLNMSFIACNLLMSVANSFVEMSADSLAQLIQGYRKPIPVPVLSQYDLMGCHVKATKQKWDESEVEIYKSELLYKQRQEIIEKYEGRSNGEDVVSDLKSMAMSAVAFTAISAVLSGAGLYPKIAKIPFIGSFIDREAVGMSAA